MSQHQPSQVAAFGKPEFDLFAKRNFGRDRSFMPDLAQLRATVWNTRKQLEAEMAAADLPESEKAEFRKQLERDFLDPVREAIAAVKRGEEPAIFHFHI